MTEREELADLPDPAKRAEQRKKEEAAHARRRDRPRILFLAHLLPWPLDGGGQIKSYHTLRILAEEYEVTLVAFTRRPGDERYLTALQPHCAGGIHLVRLPRTAARDAVAALLALLRDESFLMTRDHSAEMSQLMDDLVGEAQDRRRPFAAIHVDHLQMMRFVPEECLSRVVLDNHNVEHRIPQRIAETPGVKPLPRWYARQEWPKLRDFEADACHRANMVLTVSREDADTLTKMDRRLNDKIAVVPIGVDLVAWGGVMPREEATEILSIGTMYWPPNVDALLYFCAEILPLVRASLPDARLTIVGARPTAEILALADHDPLITVTGLVDDVRPYAERGGVFIVPLRSGSGMRVKILNAMAMRLPVVSTTVGAEGIDVTDGVNILLADHPRAFASAVIEMLNDRKRAREIGQGGRRLMEEAYDWSAVGRQLLTAYADLLSTSPARSSAKEAAAAEQALPALPAPVAALPAPTAAAVGLGVH